MKTPNFNKYSYYLVIGILLFLLYLIKLKHSDQVFLMFGILIITFIIFDFLWFIKDIYKLTLKRNIYKKDERVYPLYRLDKNISWHNVYTYPMGLLYGIITLEWLKKSEKYMKWRLKPFKIWLPPKYV